MTVQNMQRSCGFAARSELSYVNLIPLNRGKGGGEKTTKRTKVLRFQKILRAGILSINDL